MKRGWSIVVVWWLSVGVWAQSSTLAVLAVNDIHAAIDRMPALMHVCDSLRAVYPDFLLLSAGDNRTGNPYNDYSSMRPSPMTQMMNRMGFDASAVGNHEFDQPLGRLSEEIEASNFHYLAANLAADGSNPEAELVASQVRPTLIRGTTSGWRVAIVGLTQVGLRGTPDAKPANMRGLRFEPWESALCRVRWKRLRAKNNVLILLSHAGMAVDTLIARKFGQTLDLIVGGHDHLWLPEGYRAADSLLLVQNDDRLRHASLVLLDLEDGRVVQSRVESVDLGRVNGSSAVMRQMLEECYGDTLLGRVVGRLERPVVSRADLAALECRAFLETTGADMALLNLGAVRCDSLRAGEVTMADLLAVDPFADELMMVWVPAADVEPLVSQCRTIDRGREPAVLWPDLADGVVRMATSSYLYEVLDLKRYPSQALGKACHEALAEYLKKDF